MIPNATSLVVKDVPSNQVQYPLGWLFLCLGRLAINIRRAEPFLGRSEIKGMRVDEFDVPENLYYSKEHQWLSVEGEKCRVGLTDYAQKQLHEIVYVDLPKPGAGVTTGEAMGSVESVKGVSDIFSPLSGEVLEINKNVQENPGIINTNPYKDGWVVIVKASKLKEDLASLLSAEAYCSHIKTLLKA
jgi:glycine cleavage system H protein